MKAGEQIGCTHDALVASACCQTRMQHKAFHRSGRLGHLWTANDYKKQVETSGFTVGAGESETLEV